MVNLINKRYSIRTKILFFHLFVMLIVIVSILLFNKEIYEESLLANEIEKASLLADIMSLDIASKVELGLMENVKRSLDDAMEKNPKILAINIYDNSNAMLIALKNRYLYKEHIKATSLVVAPRSEQNIATFELFYSKKDYDYTVKTHRFFIFIVLLFITFMFLISSFRIKKYITPLVLLSKKIDEFDPNNPKVNIKEVATKDEIGDTQNALHRMQIDSVAYYNELRNINSNLEYITLKRTEELEEQKNLFLVMAENSPIAIALYKEKIIYANPSFLKISGYSLEELLQISIYELLGEKDRENLKNVARKRLEGNLRENITYKDLSLIRKNGERRHIFVTTSHVIVGGENAGLINGMDITESRKKDELLLIQSRFSAMGEMIGNIAHQWRQPLNVIKGTITKIPIYKAMNTIDDSFLDKSVEIIVDQVDYLSNTIDDFRGFYKDDIGEKFSLNDSLKSALNLVSATYENNFIETSIKYSRDEIFLHGSKNRLNQVIINLLNNSKDAILDKTGDDGGRVEVEIRKDNAFVQIIISDNGGGIKEEYLNKIFDPYFTTKNRSQGSGVGLYMSKKIVEDNFKGEIIAENIKFEKKIIGVRFIIFIPINESSD